MPRRYEVCGEYQSPGSWARCNRKIGHTGQHADSKSYPAVYWNQTDKEKQESK